MAQTRPSRIIQPTAKLCADNAGDVELSSHKKAIANAQHDRSLSTSASISTWVPILPSQSTTATVSDDSDSQHEVPITKTTKRRFVESDREDNNSCGDNESNISLSTESTPRRLKPKKKKKKAR